jgi:futalosine hydrolase
MRILLVAATALETRALTLQWKQIANPQPAKLLASFTFHHHQIDLLIAGIGIANTTLLLGQQLSLISAYDLCLNIGIAGSYDERFPVGTTCQIIEDGYADLGAETPNGFRTVEELGFPLFQGLNSSPDGMLINPKPLSLSIPEVSAITVNTVSGTQPTIDFRRQRWNKSLETMEGAAFFQAMLHFQQPFAAIRSVSNPVEVRNPNHWNIQLALEQLHATIIAVLEQLNA